MPYWTISDLSPPVAITGNGFRPLEVAALSRVPIEAAAKWDTTGREPTGDGYAPRVSSTDIPSTETVVDLPASDVRPSRGFLRVDLRGGLSVYAVRWKSSRGEGGTAADLDNAAQRERQAAGVVIDAQRRLASGGSVLVGGDFNIQAPGREERAGTDPTIDCTPEVLDASAVLAFVRGEKGADRVLLRGLEVGDQVVVSALDAAFAGMPIKVRAQSIPAAQRARVDARQTTADQP